MMNERMNLSEWYCIVRHCIALRFIILLCFFLTLILIFFISTSQKVVLEEHLRYDLFSVEWDVKP